MHHFCRAARVVLAEFVLRQAHLANVGIKIQPQQRSRDQQAGLLEPHRAFRQHILALLAVEQVFGFDHLPTLAQFDIAVGFQLIVFLGLNVPRVDEGSSSFRRHWMPFKSPIHLQRQWRIFGMTEGWKQSEQKKCNRGETKRHGAGRIS